MSGRYMLADAISAIKNWRTIDNGRYISIPHSKFTESVVKVLEENKVIAGFEVIDLGNNIKQIKIEIRFNTVRKNVISDFKIISKPSKRVYLQKDEIRNLVKKFRASLFISSTSKGVMTASEAIDKGLGGEMLCEINISLQ